MMILLVAFILQGVIYSICMEAIQGMLREEFQALLFTYYLHYPFLPTQPLDECLKKHCLPKYLHTQAGHLLHLECLYFRILLWYIYTILEVLTKSI